MDGMIIKLYKWEMQIPSAKQRIKREELTNIYDPRQKKKQLKFGNDLKVRTLLYAAYT